jgi:transcription initiation factor TFIID TATA-box-binding protein
LAEFESLGVDVDGGDNFTVQNMVFSGELCDSLNQGALAIGLGLEHIEYEPEQFPGLIYRPDELNVAILLFASGKLVVTGVKSPDEATEAFDFIERKVSDLGML